MKYKCHTCHIVIHENDLIDGNCPQCKSNLGLKEMCPKDNLTCTHEVVDKLAYCPFCGERHDLEVRYVDRRDREGQPVCIICGKCGCSGPWDYCSTPAPAEEEEYLVASKLWNPRHESDTLPEWAKEAIKKEFDDTGYLFRDDDTDDGRVYERLLNNILSLRKPEIE